MKTLLIIMLGVVMMANLTANADLVGEWLFNEGSGKVAEDTSENGNNGDINDAEWIVEGKYGSALNFDGKSSSVVIDHSDIITPVNAATVTVWVNPRNFTNAISSVLSKGGNHKDFDLQVEAGGVMKWYVSSAPTNYNVSAKTIIPFDQWTFVSATYEASKEISIYINGKLEGTTAMAEERDPSTEPLRIGISFWANRFWDGYIDEVRIFDTVLSEKEIEEVMETEMAVAAADKLATKWGAIKSE